MTDSMVYWAWMTLGLYPNSCRVWKVLRDMVFPDVVYEAIANGDNPGFSEYELRKLKAVNLSQAEYLLETCHKRNINVYCPYDEAYPRNLLEIDVPPTLLFTYGRLENVSFTPSIAMIGSREADDYAMCCADILSYELAQKGLTVISGFARGIDSAAHNAALRAGGQTVAVLGCGLEYDYPRNSSKFKERIAENGVVISEYMPNARPDPGNFKVRNRIVSGVSNGVAVICAGKRSGTLNTVSHAVAQGKDVFVLPPHDIFSGSYDGNIGLLRDGATPIYAAKDIFNNLNSDL